MGTREHAFVVGGGPAGLVAAIALRRKGLRVTVADGGDLPSDKACGEGILPAGIAALSRLGVELDWTEGRAFQGIRFVNAHSSAEAGFGSRAGLGMRRVALHGQLIRAAVQAGVTILRKTPVNKICEDRVSVAEEAIQADWIIGADGFRSQTRRWAKLGEKKPSSVRYAFRQHFACEPWTDFVEVHWAAKAQLYITPVSN